MTLLIKYTASISAEAMLTLLPARIVWELQVKKSNSNVSLTELQSYGMMNASYATLVKTSFELQLLLHTSYYGKLGSTVHQMKGMLEV